MFNYTNDQCSIIYSPCWRLENLPRTFHAGPCGKAFKGNAKGHFSCRFVNTTGIER